MCVRRAMKIMTLFFFRCLRFYENSATASRRLRVRCTLDKSIRRSR